MNLRSRVLLCLALAAAAVASVSPALANGRPPATSDVRPRDGTEEILAGTTFGVSLTDNGGQSWRWVCEDAVGYGGSYDPDYEWSPTGGIFVAAINGLRISRDRCTYDPPPAFDRLVAALAFGSDGALYVAANDDAESRIYRSTDEGKTFPQVSVAVPEFKDYDFWTSIEVAPSDPTRVYLAGVRFSSTQPRVYLLYRSTDAGKNFTAMTLPAFTPTMDSEIYLAGVSRTNPQVLYVRVTLVAGNDVIYRSADGGATWSPTPVLAKPDSLRAFVIRRNGDILAGTPTQGAFKSTDGINFTPLAGAPHLGCLSERADGVLFGCTQNYGTGGDNAGIMKSSDGVAWTPVLRYQDIAGPQSCAAGTLQKDSCEISVWCGMREQLGISSTVIDCPLIIPDGMPDGGMQPGSSGGGCCDTGHSSPSLLLCGLTALVLAWRKRRPARS